MKKWSTKCHWERFYYHYFGFPLSVPFQKYSILINIHTLLLPEIRIGETWKSSKKVVLSGNLEELDRQEGIRTYVRKVVVDLPSYTASHPECREFHAPRG